MYKISKMPLAVDIGYVGETGFRKLEIDMKDWMRLMPEGVPSIVCIRPGETKADAYVAVTTFEDDVLTWVITAADIGTQEGEGEIQIWLEEEENSSVIKRGKSVKVKTRVNDAVNDPSPDTPTSQEAFIEQVTSLKTAAVNAKTAAEDAKDDAVAAKEAAEAAQAAAEAVNLHPAYIDETTGHWMTWDTEEGDYVDSEVDAQGPQGDPGTDATPDLITKDYSDLTFPVAKDTLCYHSGLLYKANQDISTSEAWTAAHWTATTIEAEQTLLKTAIQGKPEIKNSTKTGVDLDISDENGNVLLRMKDGDIETENFNSADAPAMKNSTKTGVDLDFADPNGNVVLRCKDGHIETEKFNSKENGIPKCYVSPSGSDSNDGTKEHPFATFQKAINEGYKKIFASDGVYSNQRIVMDGLDGITILCNSSGLEDNIFESHKRRKRAKIDNSIDIGELTQDGSVYKAPLTVSNDSSYYKVFISQTVDPVYSGSAYYGRVTTYNAILWEITDSILTCTRLVPKLTKVECEATQGTFFFDGDYIYINPTDGDVSGKTYKRLNLDTNQYGVDIRNCTDIHIQGIDIAFFPYYDLYFGHCEDITVKDCCFTFTCYGNTVEFNGADATVISCLAAQAGADGFGIAGYGDCSFYDCSAIRCYDDGISHHDGSTGVIDGGLWMNCLKGGVTPSYGSNVSVKNVVCKGNVYGIYYPQSGERITDAVLIMQNCLAISNTTKDIKISGYDVLSHGCSYGTKEVDTGSTLTEYGNTVIS